MTYHILNREFDPKIVGATDGIGQFIMDPEFDEANPWYDQIFFHLPRQSKDWWKYWSRMPTHGNKLLGLTMFKKSKHTDYVDAGGFFCGFIVSTRFRELLEKFHLPNHKFFEATFNQNGKVIENYWWFVYDLDTGKETVDFVKSEFDLSSHVEQLGRELTINSYQDYLSIFYETGRGIRAKKIVFNKNFDKELDIFGTQFLSPVKAYVSSRMIKAWDEAKIIGYYAHSLDEAKFRAERINDPFCELIFE